MSLSFCVLASGSGGNCSVVVREDLRGRRCLLMDAGLSPRRTIRALADLGVKPGEIHGILLTHLDRDHFYPSWAKIAAREHIRIFAHRQQRTRLFKNGASMRHVKLFDDDFEIDRRTHVEIVRFAHDDAGSTGYVINHGGVRLGWATDLGRTTNALFDRFTQLDALAMESNYDRRLQVESGRPAMLKRRIMNGFGHLSNDESFRAVRRIAENSRLRRIVALHLSRECNSPSIVQRLYEQEAPELADRLTISAQDAPTPMLSVIPAAPTPRVAPLVGAQMALFG